MMPKLIVLARRRSSGVIPSTGTPNIAEAVMAWMSRPSAKACLQLRDVGDVGEQPQLDLAVVGRDELVPGSARRRRVRILRPSSVRIGMFCRFGSDEDSRPVVVAASE